MFSLIYFYILAFYLTNFGNFICKISVCSAFRPQTVKFMPSNRFYPYLLYIIISQTNNLHIPSFHIRILNMAVEFNFKTYKKDIESKMGKSLESLQAQFNTIRAGQATPSMLDRIFVDYFGTPTPLNQVARVGTSGSQQLTIEPFEKSVCKEIEKAIATSDLNLTPNSDGS